MTRFSHARYRGSPETSRSAAPNVQKRCPGLASRPTIAHDFTTIQSAVGIRMSAEASAILIDTRVLICGVRPSVRGQPWDRSEWPIVQSADHRLTREARRKRSRLPVRCVDPLSPPGWMRPERATWREPDQPPSRGVHCAEQDRQNGASCGSLVRTPSPRWGSADTTAMPRRFRRPQLGYRPGHE